MVTTNYYTILINRIIISLKNRITESIDRFKSFSGYYNTHHRQKKWTKIALNKIESGQSYSWGKSIENEDALGNYIKIKDQFLLPNIIDKTVLEVGCLDGKWSQYIVPIAKHSTLVDLSKEILPALKVRLEKGGGSWTFYETKGDELEGLDDHAFDFIFSMDTFVRVKKKFLMQYFRHFKRVLKHDGKMVIHLPCTASPDSDKNNFVGLHPDEITDMMISNEFKEFTFDFSTIKHGVLLKYGL